MNATTVYNPYPWLPRVASAISLAGLVLMIYFYSEITAPVYVAVALFSLGDALTSWRYKQIAAMYKENLERMLVEQISLAIDRANPELLKLRDSEKPSEILAKAVREL